MPWSMITPWSANAFAVEPEESAFAATAASIGAATLALAATARSIGAATARSRSRSALRSSRETTSLSGRSLQGFLRQVREVIVSTTSAADTDRVREQKPHTRIPVLQAVLESMCAKAEG